jgi:hypothetical protein
MQGISMRPGLFLIVLLCQLALCGSAFAQKSARVICGPNVVARFMFKQADTMVNAAALSCGAVVEVMSYVEKNRVYEVRLSTGQTGYVHEDAIAVITDAEAAFDLAAQGKMIADLTRRLADLESRVQALTLLISRNGSTAQTPTIKTPMSECSSAIESTISGDFSGWNGETIFKLDNGQIWQQAEYDYMYSYSYRPDVTIYETSGGCRMKVEDEDETIIVKRIR